jgi:Rod binding domain-containing protein
MNISRVDTSTPVDTAQLRRSGAARDFEALLVGQMLRSVREGGSGWLGTGDDQSSEAAFGLGEEQLARALSSSGGFGLSKIIDAGLRAETSKAAEQRSR